MIRIVIGILLLLSALTCGVLGALHMMSAGYEKITAQTEVNDLSAVAGDLVDEAQLEKMRQEAAKAIEKVNADGQREKTLGILSFVLVGLLLLASILTFIKRGKMAVVGLTALAAVTHAGLLVWGGVATLGIVALVVMILALVLTLVAQSAFRPRTA